MTYDHVSAFFWKSSLSEERKQAIVDWVKSLPKDNQKMIDEMIRDAQDEQRYNDGEC